MHKIFYTQFNRLLIKARNEYACVVYNMHV